MSYNPSISLANVSKLYRMYNNPQDRLKQFFYREKKKLYSEFWALKGVSFDILKGQTVGIIGKNGSGKSTLLQIVTQTLQPSSGDVSINGRIAALLELGSGFNPEYTGRENVYLNGSIMGLTTKEIDDRMHSIESFAEIGSFIDQPVKVYSSGMFVRLAFACAVNVDPDILIIDEALSVGDMQFQLKCMEKMKSFKREGKTILFVSHDTYSIKNFCDEVIWMKNGEIHLRGDVQRVTDLYEDYMREKPDEEVLTKNDVGMDSTNSHLTINNISFSNSNGEQRNNFKFGEDLYVDVEFTIHEAVEGMVGGVAVIDSQNTYICGLNTKLDQYSLPNLPGKYKLQCLYNEINLLPGSYHVDVGFFESSAVARLDYKTKANTFTVSSDKYIAEGISFLNHKWICKGV